MRVVLSVLADAFFVLAFVVIGRANHHAGESLAGIASTAWPFLAGLAAGLAAHYGRLRMRATLPVTVAIAAVGWGLALWGLVLRGLPDGAVAREVAALAGLPPHATVTVIVALLVAVIQALAGLWLGRAVAPGYAR